MRVSNLEHGEARYILLAGMCSIEHSEAFSRKYYKKKDVIMQNQETQANSHGLANNSKLS